MRKPHRAFRPRPAVASAAVAVAALALAPAAARAQGAPAAPAPRIKAVRCYSGCLSKRTVVAGGRVEIRGRGLAAGMRAVFPVRAAGVAAARSAKTRATRRGTLIARVPRDARTGKLFVQVPDGARSNGAKVKVARGTASGARPRGNTPFDGNGMWIWYVSKSSGGDLQSIVAMARAHDVGTVFVKSGDGSSYWDQFSPELVSALKAGGLDVCAWQFVYGNSPATEASLAAKAVRTGADCFVIDAEGQYERKYSQAGTYVSRLRAAVGPDYPIGLAGFPYVDYHPSFPYSVFLGPAGAQYNVPQAYWKDIGGSVDAVLAHTYRFNRPYGRPIFPLGQLYQSPSSRDIKRFRQVAAAQGSTGVSWWDWQEASAKSWDAVGGPLGPFAGPPPPTDYALLAKGSKGDLVLWAQEHLRAAGQAPPVDGGFDAATQDAVVSFQAASGLPPTGQVDTATWDALLRYSPGSTAPAKRVGKAGGSTAPAKRAEISPPGER
ncbi:MAG TPA: peptidoglycan-binding domain-containing protein [Thermoleophilaceae bacterium]|jgi:hypothetical protein